MTAVEQGEVAARNMIGIRTPYDGSIKNNITEVFGFDVAVVGYNRDDCAKTITRFDERTGVFRKAFLDEAGTLIGVTMIGETNDSGIYYGMIRRREKLEPWNRLNQRLNYAKILRRFDVR
jgi:NAD(P)H-nitrite reductase large subunit